MMWKKIRDNLYLAAESVKGFFIKLFRSRITILGIVFILLFGILIGRLFNLQIVLADYYTENYELLSMKTIETQGARGNIYDCNGVLLAHNEIAYNVTLTDEIESSDERGTILNAICDNTVKIIEENGDSITVDFNIELDDDGNYAFKEDPDITQITFLCNVFGLTSSEIYEEGYDEYTAAQIIEYMVNRFDISDEYTAYETLRIATLRYALSLNSYQKYVSTEIAENVSQETKAAILESSDDLTGVDIEETYIRVYDYGEYVAAILGYTGEISEEELEEYNESNDAGITYSSGDIVGKSGVEKTFDSYLQGTKGSQTVYVNTTGTILDVIDEEASSSGNDLYLSIDIELQIVAYTTLEQEIASALVNKIVDYDYDAKTDYDSDSDTYVYIPVKDVYYQLLTNVIDIEEFDRDGASDREQSVLAAFETKRDGIIETLVSELVSDSPSAVGDLSDEYNEYMYEIYEVLKDAGILVLDSIDTSDEVYIDWAGEDISLKEFLIHAISENWLDLTAMDTGSAYLDSDEIYDALVEYIPELLCDDYDFSELVYYYMVYDEEISAYNIIMMLYDQEILEEDEAYEELVNGEISTYTYVINQISDLNITPAMIALDPCSGSLIITDVDTGKVLAMATYPSYDNNMLSGTIDSDYWEKLTTDDSSPLYNRSTQTLTAPGSTYKIVTSIAALSEGYTTTTRTIYDAVTFDLISPSPTCHGHGSVDLNSAIAYSCNYYFYQLGYEMGITNGSYDSETATDLLTEYAIALGLGIKSGIEIEESEPSNSTTDSVRSAIGQGTNAYAPIQLARYVNTIANQGVNYALSLVECVVDSDGNTVLSVEPEITNTVELSESSWSAILSGMRNVCLIGTGKSFFTELETTVAGKTGTSQENAYRSAHATFIGFAPYEDPEISFVCVIRNSDSTSYPGAVLCTTLQYYFGEITYDEVMESAVSSSLLSYSTD